MHARSEVVLVAIVAIDEDAQSPQSERLRRIGCEVIPDFESMISEMPRLQLDVCIVPTPIHLHCAHTVALLHAKVNVLVEKPLTATLRDADLIVAAQRATQRFVAVGFQYLHAAEVQALKSHLRSGAIGAVKRVSVLTLWPRSHEYYSRNHWAGRLRIADAWVLDSPIANAMAHFFMLLLYLSGEGDESSRISEMSAELYRVQEIESFDTAVVSMVTTTGCRLDFYGTHSSRETTRPLIRVEGERGHAEWVQDSHASLDGPAGSWRQEASAESVTRERMLRDVLAHSSGEERFICTPELAREHVRCVNALQAHVPIHVVEEDSKRLRQERDETFTYVPGLDEHLSVAFTHRCDLHSTAASWSAVPTRFTVQQDPVIEAAQT
jgi:predicted dehydrogenase